MASSRVDPKKQLTIPRLELSAALTGAQLSQLLKSELTIPIDKTVLWSDSTVVLTWPQSESCRYKVFVANRITEILDLISPDQWQYVETHHNPADDITRGKRLTELTELSRWNRGPGFLALHSNQWPAHLPKIQGPVLELRKPLFCSLTQIKRHPDLPDPSQFSTWQDLVEATRQHLQETANYTPTGTPSFNQAEVETLLLSKAQSESFP